MRSLIPVLVIALITTAGQLPGCFSAGANFHQQAPGNNERGGVSLDGDGYDEEAPSGGFDVGTTFNFQEIAVDPQGSYFLSASQGRLIHGDLKTGAVELLEGVDKPSRVAFAHLASRFYVVSKATGSLLAIDPARKKILWEQPLPTAQSNLVRLYTSEDDQRVAILESRTLDLREASTGALISSMVVGEVQDLDFTPDGGELLVTRDTVWSGSEPTTSIWVLDAGNGTLKTTISVPNCTSHLVLTPDGGRGFLSPTNCNAPGISKDPVSVINLQTKQWTRNLPGFGPVAMASDGVTAVAFMDAANLDLDLFGDLGTPPSSEEARYHLMLINSQTLSFRSVPLGDAIPRYTLTPDGQVVLIDYSSWISTKEDRIRVLDVETMSLQTVTGPQVELDHFVMSPNSEDLYLLDQSDLYWLSIPNHEVVYLKAPWLFSSMNITPDGKSLLLLDYQDTLHLYDLEQGVFTRALTPPTIMMQ